MREAPARNFSMWGLHFFNRCVHFLTQQTQGQLIALNMPPMKLDRLGGIRSATLAHNKRRLNIMLMRQIQCMGYTSPKKGGYTMCFSEGWSRDGNSNRDNENDVEIDNILEDTSDRNNDRNYNNGNYNKRNNDCCSDRYWSRYWCQYWRCRCCC